MRYVNSFVAFAKYDLNKYMRKIFRFKPDEYVFLAPEVIQLYWVLDKIGTYIEHYQLL